MSESRLKHTSGLSEEEAPLPGQELRPEQRVSLRHASRSLRGLPSGSEGWWKRSLLLCPPPSLTTLSEELPAVLALRFLKLLLETALRFLTLGEGVREVAFAALKGVAKEERQQTQGLYSEGRRPIIL